MSVLVQEAAYISIHHCRYLMVLLSVRHVVDCFTYQNVSAPKGLSAVLGPKRFAK